MTRHIITVMLEAQKMNAIGMAHAVKGAKKYVRTRIRFHENAAVKKLIDFFEE